ncbi:hypothetical protein [Aneurinibacillus aneurinilyticus]|uniref:hypothetical protein n=1 Tax=Aneurinibacillus aneurinilyticus TaxID=1391 RepID=UPI003524BEA0
MEWSLAITICLLVAFFILLKRSRNSKRATRKSETIKVPRRSVPESFKKPIPKQLGLLPHAPLYEMAGRLDGVMDGEFGRLVKTRVMAKHPDWTEKMYSWILFEWKRYFLMASLYKSVPMYSEDVDEIWHEMLMFTREYEKLCVSVAGEMIHHEPNIERKPDSEERALFDVMYSLLFEVQSASWDIWGNFFRSPLSRETARRLSERGEADIHAMLFRNHPVVAEATRHLADRLHEMLKEAASNSSDFARKAKSKTHYGNLEKVAVVVILYSLLSTTDFEREIQFMLGMEIQSKAAASGAASSGCSAYTSGGGNSCSSNNDCNDSGGSSCGSSCGGGCSS